MLAYPHSLASYATASLFIPSNVHRTFGFTTVKLHSIHCSSVPDFAVVFAHYSFSNTLQCKGRP
jgi:hypothetical protein